MLINRRNGLMAGPMRLSPVGTAEWGFYVESLESGSSVAMNTYATRSTVSAPSVTIEYSVDAGRSWSPLVVGATVVPVAGGKRVYFRAGEGGNAGFCTTGYIGNSLGEDVYGANVFDFSGKVAIGGDIMSLLYHAEAQSDAASLPKNSVGIFGNLFRIFSASQDADALVDASSLELPAAGQRGLLINAFRGCISLTGTPDLSYVNPKIACYWGAFRGCSSLTTAPRLPATVADGCYYSMFSGCTSLTTAPKLPATTLAQSCYAAMFFGCTSLVVAPALPCTTLNSNCYQQMFYNCTSLAVAPELPATTLATSCYNDMFRSCKSLTASPELPATTLAPSCYTTMFYLCSNLATAPKLPAETLVSRCYWVMLYGTKITNLEVAFSAWPEDPIWLQNWVGSLPRTGTFRCPSALGTDETITRDASHCPVGWTVVNTDAV